MNSLSGRHVVLAVSGGIAAYKAVDVARTLVDAGAHVAPIMTEDAHRFIGPVTLSALSSEKVHTSLWDDDSAIPHTKLAQRTDVIVVAPATARVISAYATGSSEDLLTATLIATRAPVVVCPAMHTEMWEHPAVQDNIALLRRRGVIIVEPEHGRLAGGDVGQGRLASTESIVAAVEGALNNAGDFAGVKLVVTAGGTREPIDAVRVIANRSSGKQGHAIAVEAMRRGAEVTLITTADLATPSGISVVRVETAAQMHDAVAHVAASADVVVMAAAVADFRPVPVASGKWKKRDGAPVVSLEPTVDILADIARSKHPTQVLVGFAAETDDVLANAQAKLETKRLDLLVANDVSAPGVGFQHDTNAVTLLTPGIAPRHVPLAGKHEIARAVLDSVAEIRSRISSSHS
ncbi:MAG: bifunctional phosphopantothenoylcysteine decarboxylase/phosphopantothenate--cysteine ligase CoaBC [Ilumatobacteraceae bacterium]|nr:bifunctional phosphopantothenoylcysteine decarboxylase/phosphopantothenate--cysteine ligase CoaBC [Ilumatobacteraceae bacterium]